MKSLEFLKPALATTLAVGLNAKFLRGTLLTAFSAVPETISELRISVPLESR